MEVQEVIAQARDAITVKRVFGEPYEKNGVTVIPAARVQGGAGGGGGEGPEGQGKGSGTGRLVWPEDRCLHLDQGGDEDSDDADSLVVPTGFEPVSPP